MILRRNNYQSRPLENCHEGKGRVWFAELLADYNKPDAGLYLSMTTSLSPALPLGNIPTRVMRKSMSF